MEYAQLNESKTDALQITTHGNVEWDSTHYCPASKLTEEEATLFRVVPLTPTDPPAIDPLTQRVYRDGCEFIGGAWQYKWVAAVVYQQPEMDPEQSESSGPEIYANSPQLAQQTNNTRN